MLRPLFVYGTLMDPDFLSGLLADHGIARHLEFAPARLDGWRRGRVRGASYPGIVALEGASTEGMLLFIQSMGEPRGIDDAVAEILDEYEGALYERIAIDARTPSDLVPAQVYALKAEHQHILESEDWRPS